MKTTSKKALSFIEGYSKSIYNNVIGLSEHIQEQVAYRLGICKNTCGKAGKCEYCGCNSSVVVFTKESCNGGEKFPDLMNKEEWEHYKQSESYEDSHL